MQKNATERIETNALNTPTAARLERYPDPPRTEGCKDSKLSYRLYGVPPNFLYTNGVAAAVRRLHHGAVAQMARAVRTQGAGSSPACLTGALLDTNHPLGICAGAANQLHKQNPTANQMRIYAAEETSPGGIDADNSIQEQVQILPSASKKYERSIPVNRKNSKRTKNVGILFYYLKGM